MKNIWLLLVALSASITVNAQSADSTYMKGQVMYPDSTKIEHSLDYEVKTFDDYVKATGQTQNGEFETSFITSVKDNNDYKTVENLEALTDLKETNTSQLAIKYRLPSQTNVDVKIYSILGELVKDFDDKTETAGNYHTYWNYKNDNGQNVANGIYFYVVQTEQGTIVNKFDLVDGYVWPGKETTVEAQKIKQPTTLPKTKNNTYKITFTDPTETVRNAEFQITLPDTSLDVFLQELITYNQSHNLTEGDTLKIPLDDFNIKTGTPKNAYVNNPDLESFIAQNILNIYNKDTNFSGSRAIPVTITAPHDSDSTLYIDANWADVSNFTLNIQDMFNYDEPIVTPTKVTFDQNPNTQLDDKIFMSDASGDISGKLPPGTYRMQVSNENYNGDIFIVKTDDGQHIRYFPGNQNPTIDLSNDVTGAIGLEPGDYSVDSFERILNRTGSAGTDMFMPLPNHDLEWVIQVLDEHNGPIPEYDEKTANIYIWKGPGNLPGKFARFAKTGTSKEMIPMTGSNVSIVEDIVTNHLPQYLDNYYKINVTVVEDDNIPLRLIVDDLGDTIAMPQKSAIIIYAGKENSHVEYQNNSLNENYAMKIILYQNDGRDVSIGTAKSEIDAGFGESSDIDDPNHESVNLSQFNTFSPFTEATPWDKKTVRMHLRWLKNGFRHVN